MEIIAMKSFIEDQMLKVRQSRKDSTLPKSSCHHNSEIASLIEEIAYLWNEKRTNSCIIQALLENESTQQKPPVANKSDFKAPNKYVRSSKNHSAKDTYVSTSNRYQELSNNGDIEKESNTVDCVKPTEVADSNKTSSGKKIVMTQGKNQQIQ